MTPKVSIVIITWNSRQHIGDCLAGLQKQTYTNYTITLVDNASQDDTIEYLTQNHPHLTIICNQTNRGFAQAANQGIRASEGEFILLLNPDVFPEPMFLEILVKSLSLNKHYGAVGGKLLLYKNGKSRIIDSTGLFLTRGLKAYDRGNGKEDRGHYEQEETVFAVCGAAVLFRREALEKVQVAGEYFDEDFFAYYEDLDLCWRMHLLGFASGYAPQAVAYHVRGGSGLKSNFFEKTSFMQQITLRNRYLMLIKNLALKEFFFFSPAFFLTEFVIFLYSCTRAPYLFKVYRDVNKSLKKFLKKRSLIQQSRKEESRSLCDWLKTGS